MAVFQSKKSVLGVKKETTEGEPVWPTANTNFVPIQEDVSFEPAFDVLDNAELSGSIGASKKILGLEDPSGSFSLYLKHSGVEGQAPNYGDLLEAVFGATATASTEYDLVAGSTTTVLNVDAGEGATFEVGEALLIKDGTNNYQIRTIKSIATDALTLDFALAVAPASLVNLGKAVLYKPADTGHPTLTLTDYRADNAAIQQLAGTRVTEYTIDVAAGQLINQNFSVNGTNFGFNPIEITALNDDLDFEDSATTEINVSVTQKTYKDPHELATAIADAMNASAGIDVYTCTFNDAGANAGKFTLTSDTSTFKLLFATGTNTATTIAGAIGFDTADETGAITYSSDSVQDYSNSFGVSFDQADPLAAKNMEAFLGDQADNVCFEVNNMSLSVADTKANIDQICAESGRSGSIVSERAVEVTLQAFIPQHDAEKFKNFRENTTVQFLFNFGTRSGGNWEAGKSGCFAMHTCTLSSFSLSDLDGLVAMDATLSGFVSSGASEVFLNFL